jgi:hypothetical protein
VDARAQICKAIAEKRLLSFQYKGQLRVAEPQILGKNQKSTEILSAWFLSGASESEEGEGWRDYTVALITELRLLRKKFSGPRPGYVSGGGKKFREVFCELAPAIDVERFLEDIAREKQPNLKSQKLAALCSTLFRRKGYELVVVGGSAIEFYTDGEYTSGDLDLCTIHGTLPFALRGEVMRDLGAKGGPRNWVVGGMYVDLLNEVEAFAQTGFTEIEAPWGKVRFMPAEDLLVERVLSAIYPQRDDEALAVARILAGNMLRGEIETDWTEVARIASLPEYRIFPELKAVLRKVSNELKVENPLGQS